MRKIVLAWLNKRKSERNGFKDNDWGDTFFAKTNCPSVHISEVKFEELSDSDLVRCFEYIIPR